MENKCPQCGAPIDPASSECKYCGEKITLPDGANGTDGANGKSWKEISTKGMNIKHISPVGIVMLILGVFVNAFFSIIYGILLYTGNFAPKGLKVEAEREGKYCIVSGLVFIVINIFCYIFVY